MFPWLEDIPLQFSMSRILGHAASHKGNKIMTYLVHVFKHTFSVFKQHYIYFHTLFHPHVFSKNTNNVIINLLPNGPLVIRKWYYIWSSKFGRNINYISDFYPNIKFLFKLYYMELYLHKDIRTKTKKTSICKYYKSNNI